MRISHFSVENFRSITKAYKLPLEDLTVIIGPNNEGKSNILAALNIALSTLAMARLAPIGARRAPGRISVVGRIPRMWRYDWTRDFPMQMRQSKPDGKSKFSLEFDFTPDELKAFNQRVGSQLTTALKLQVEYSSENSPSVEVRIQGLSKKALNARLDRVVGFLQEQVGFQYIPSIRDVGIAQGVVDELVAQELAQLGEDPQYRKAIEKLHELQVPVLKRLGDEIQKTISAFIPDVTAVRLDTSDELSDAVSRSCRIYVNDGNETELAYKGDGIKSLAAIALMRHAASQPGSGRKRPHLVLAVEEPEVHLHPRAVRTLKPVLAEIARSAQVIISTHSPLLADAERPSRNILVSGSRATPAKTIAQVRALLGVELGDNLQSANMVLLVEGESDRKVVTAWLSQLSPALRQAITQRQLIIQGIGGASKLCAQVATCRAGACAVHVFFDDDAEASTNITKALDRKLLTMAEIQQSICHGMKEAELEDMINVDAYRGDIEQEFGILLTGPEFRGADRKWSDRLRDTMKRHSKNWNDRIEEAAKTLVATLAEGTDASLNSQKQAAIVALKDALERRMADGS